MTLLNKKGVSLVETLASIVIITFVLVTILTIVVNARKETYNTNQRVLAISIANQIRDDINQSYSYLDVSDVLSTENINVNSNNCNAIELTDLCDVFSQTFENENYNRPITITFLAPTSESQTYGFVQYTITIEYVELRDIEIEGIIYE